MIAVIDYGTGNLCSVANALGRLGAEYCVTSDPQTIISAERVILPGVGAAGHAMDKLHERKLTDIIRGLTQPVLGICIGMQLMTRWSEEGDTHCMGIFPCETRLIKADGVKVPHMGWDTVENLRTPLFKGVDEGSHFYYVHSYAPDLCLDTIAVTDYGAAFSAALSHGNFFGTQFHPEKSGKNGENILKNFLAL